ncbi:GTP-dependent dephospho-CoA kinase family protein [Halobacteriales archaeon Cl-PHB]
MTTVVELQAALRSELKEPLGPIFTDAEDLVACSDGPIVAVGDMVTYHLLQADHTPAVALVDGRTERTEVDREIRDAIGGFDREVEVANPPATLGEGLLDALREAVERAPEESTLLVVDGEEDLAALPALVVAPAGTSIVYGQPGEGMVLATVDEETRAGARELLSRFEGDTERLWSVLGVE